MAEAREPAVVAPMVGAVESVRSFCRGFVERHRFLLAFASLSSLMGISVGVAKVTTSLYAIQLGSSAAELGLIASAQSVGVLIMSLPLGFLIEQFGPGRIFVLGTLVAAALYAVVPLVASAKYLLACTALISFFMPFRFVSLNSVFMGQLESIGESKAGWYRGTHMLGMFLLGPALATLVLRALDFAGTYQAIALAFLLTMGLSPIVFGPYAKKAGAGRRLSWAAIGSQLSLMTRDAELRQVCFIESLAQGTNAYYAFFIIVVAVDVVGLDHAEASSLVAAHGLTFVLALFSLGSVVRRVGPKTTYRISFLWVAAALVMLGLAHDKLGLWLGALCLGAGLGTLQIVNLTRFARCGARLGRGRMAGLNALVAPSGAVLGNLAGSIVGKAFGAQAMFLVLAPLFVAAAWTLVSRGPAPSEGVALERIQ
jgi:MFS family permease